MLDPQLACRFSFAHRLPSHPAPGPGRHILDPDDGRSAVLIVPEMIHPARPAPLMVLFHGGGGSAEKILPMMERHAFDRGFLLLAPQSLFPTWDLCDCREWAGSRTARSGTELGRRIAFCSPPACWPSPDIPMGGVTPCLSASPTATSSPTSSFRPRVSSGPHANGSAPRLISHGIADSRSPSAVAHDSCGSAA